MAKKSLGLPYMGSKNLIAKSIVNALPKGERLVDLFAGGWHRAILSLIRILKSMERING